MSDAHHRSKKSPTVTSPRNHRYRATCSSTRTSTGMPRNVESHQSRWARCHRTVVNPAGLPPQPGPILLAGQQIGRRPTRRCSAVLHEAQTNTASFALRGFGAGRSRAGRQPCADGGPWMMRWMVEWLTRYSVPRSARLVLMARSRGMPHDEQGAGRFSPLGWGRLDGGPGPGRRETRPPSCAAGEGSPGATGRRQGPQGHRACGSRRSPPGAPAAVPAE